jgi:hypothetical protein
LPGVPLRGQSAARELAAHHQGRHVGMGQVRATCPPPTWRPRRSTLTSSAKAVTSRNLWVIISTGDRPRLRQRAHMAQHLVGLSRRQHRRRLVQDQEATAQIELLQDFQLLLLARRQPRTGWSSGT